MSSGLAFATVEAAIVAAVSYAARRIGALNTAGAVAAFFVGTATFIGLAVPGALILLAFFISSVSLSRLGKARKKELVDIDKQGPRDALQVLANGGVAALCALAAFSGDHRWAVAFAGSFAAATADTWGTEIGTLASKEPRSVLTGKPIACGLSGGVTFFGTLAEIGGALFIAFVAELVGIHAFLAIVLGGCCGALLDSVLGAGAQSLRWCSRCERACETLSHVCGEKTRALRGFSWMSNDYVNVCAALSGAIVAFFV